MTSRMLKKLALFSAAMLLALTSGMPQSEAAAGVGNSMLSANETVMLEEDTLMLSDLFSGLPAGMDARVGDAPLPGETLVIRLSTLQRIAAANGLEWTPRSSRIRVTVRRDGRAVPLQTIRTALEERLIQDYVADRIEVELTNRRLTLMVPSGTDPRVDVESLDYNSRNQRFAATITVPIGESKRLRAKVQGEVHPVIEVPVLSRHAAPGETIRVEDIIWTEMRARRSTHNTVTMTDQIVGMQVRRPIGAGRVIRRTDVKPIRLIQKGDLVTMVFRTSLMTLTLRGQALENGARRDSIRVKNLSSGKTVVGSVTDSGIVSVAGPHIAMN